MTLHTRIQRSARWLAALGLLLASMGIAILASATSASAATKVIVCHATNSDSNPYRVVVVDDNSTQLEAHKAHAANPNKIWKTDGTFQGTAHSAGDPKPDLIGVATEADCADSTPPADIEVTADVEFVDPSCANQNTASYTTTTGEYTWHASAAAAPDATITVTATVNDGYTFPNDAQTYSEEHTFGPEVDCGTPQGPRTIVPAAPSFVDPTCANGNQASFSVPANSADVVYTASGEAKPGQAIQVTATPANDDVVFEDGAVTSWPHAFAEATPDCTKTTTVVEPPTATPDTVIPALVHAGLGDQLADTRGQTGLALLATGMLVLLVSGGLGLTRRRGSLG